MEKVVSITDLLLKFCVYLIDELNLSQISRLAKINFWVKKLQGYIFRSFPNPTLPPVPGGGELLTKNKKLKKRRGIMYTP